MRDDLTDITLVIDRSGSMESIRGDAEGGVNALIADQANQPGQALLTLVEFDTDYRFVHVGAPIGSVPRYQLVPRGMTALLDAVGRAINETGARLAAIPEPERPGLVIFVVMTDGHENASKEFTKDRVRAMIEDHQSTYNWQFTFLGADASAFDEARSLGLADGTAARYDKEKVGTAYRRMSDKMSRMRGQQAAQEPVVNAFTDEERDDMT